MKQEMSLVDDKTVKLFKSFMPRRHEIKSSINELVYDLKIYSETYFRAFKPANTFEKWVLVEVSSLAKIPADMHAFSMQAGKFATFKHTGFYKDNSPFEYIYGEWLPQSSYKLDSRPHFDIMSTETEAEEQEIYIPIK